VAGVAGLILIGPGKALRLLRRGVTVAFYAGQAARLLR
jgi:hypothetical protein